MRRLQMVALGCTIVGWLGWMMADQVLALPAFPGAEGFGATTPGGRGGKVIEVTNLNDSGSGSLRACIEASGPRTCVFRTGGTVTLNSQLRITNPFITIAGQTAPGGGITLRNGSNTNTTLDIRTHDVIIRYVRVRPGPGGSPDGINVYQGAYNVIIDHTSVTWSVDENLSVTGPDNNSAAHDVTLQWNLIAEALHCSTHDKGCHSKGTLMQRSHNVSIHHNLYAQNFDRNPRVKLSSLGPADIVNNVIYNPGSIGSSGWGPSHVSGEEGTPRVNYMRNYLKTGIDTSRAYYISAESGMLYVEGNVVTGGTALRSGDEKYVVKSRHDAPTVRTTSAEVAFTEVLAQAGASGGLACNGTFFYRRDAVDQRIVDDVRNGRGHIIDDPSEVGGYPDIDRGTPCPDSDRDGMPDEWEKLHGFNPNDPSDGPADADGDGYTNLEEFLNGSNPRGSSDTTPPLAPKGLRLG